jgi:hypothetical protein
MPRTPGRTSDMHPSLLPHSHVSRSNSKLVGASRLHRLRPHSTRRQNAERRPRVPPSIRNARALTCSAQYALQSLLSLSPIQRLPFHDSTLVDSVSLPPIMTALSRSAATAVSALPPAARGPRLSVACRNPVSAAPLWGSCRMHVLLHAAVAAMMASAVFSVVHAQGWSTAQLSQARYSLSATSVGTVAIFAGGQDGKLLRILFVCCVRDC